MNRVSSLDFWMDVMNFSRLCTATLAAGLLLTTMACGDSTITDSTRGDHGASTQDDPATPEQPAQVLPEVTEYIECSVESTCDDGYACRGYCIPLTDAPNRIGSACTDDASCGGVLSCFDGVCVDPDAVTSYYRSLSRSPAEFFGSEPLVLDPELLAIPEMQTMSMPLLPGAATPGSVDLTQTGFIPLPGNQGDYGSCHAFAAGYGLASYMHAKEKGLNISRAEGDDANIMSASYLYNAARQISGDCPNDIGTYYENIVGALRTRGIPSARSFPYTGESIRACSINSTDAVRAEAMRTRITHTQQLFYNYNTDTPFDQALINDGHLARIKAQLAAGRPVVVFVRTPEEMNNIWHGRGNLDLPLTSYKAPEGNRISHDLHAMLAVGYNDSTQRLNIMNSWGRSWGARGYMNTSYDAAKHIIYGAWVATGAQIETEPDQNTCERVQQCSSDRRQVLAGCRGQQLRVLKDCGATTCTEGGQGAYCAQQPADRCASAVRDMCGISPNGQQHYVLETCNGASIGVKETCSGKCAWRNHQPYCEQANPTPDSRCPGQLTSECRVSSNRQVQFIVELCDGAYLSTKERCDTTCSQRGNQAQCAGGTTPSEPEQPTSTTEVRIEWDEALDLDMFLTEAGVGKYSYQGGARGAGTFQNSNSCYNDNAYCGASTTSVERVVWPANNPPTAALSLVVQNRTGTTGARVRVVVNHEGRTSTQMLWVPSGFKANSMSLPVQLP